MTPAPAPRRPPYWTLIALPLLLWLPFRWVALALIAGSVAKAGLAAARAATARRNARAARAAEGPTVSLGVDERGREVLLSDHQLATHGLILGASGAGKSTTLLGILGDRIARGLPVIAIDLKGSPTFADELARASTLAGRSIRVWTLDGPSHWNPLAHGGPTELKDKLIASERFTEPHYQRAAERYVQTALQVLEAGGLRPRLADVVALMEPRRLAAAARRLDSPLRDHVQDYVAGLTADQLSAARGLGTRLAIISESHAGRYLEPAADGETIDLRSALDGSEVVVFSLNSSVYGQLAAQVGTLAIQDIVSATGHRLQAGGAPIQATVAVDEFSALGADHLLALVARGREAGVSVLLATQELADLERAAPGFRDQVLGLTAVKIAHRQDVPASARTIAELAGTEWVWTESRQIYGPFGRGHGSRGTRREVERYVVHPNEVKALRTGEAVLLTKTPAAGVRRVRVWPPQREIAGGERQSRGVRRGDQAEPGVTR
ncbi:MAG TPA: TraM recognition domain-containing protein [Solirubrobacteraceae bacterium]|nr:TraM recognition domain-containing protein [Solirubrobacteraceae bacterium]